MSAQTSQCLRRSRGWNSPSQRPSLSLLSLRRHWRHQGWDAWRLVIPAPRFSQTGPLLNKVDPTCPYNTVYQWALWFCFDAFTLLPMLLILLTSGSLTPNKQGSHRRGKWTERPNRATYLAVSSNWMSSTEAVTQESPACFSAARKDSMCWVRGGQR